jgi:hypothetical protein
MTYPKMIADHKDGNPFPGIDSRGKAKELPIFGWQISGLMSDA